MPKKITPSQLLGQRGEVAVQNRFLSMQFQFDGRSRLEAGIDGIAEVMIGGQPQAQMIAVQVKTTENARYTGESESEFSYLLEADDLDYWRNSNLPVILVLYRISDESYYWKDVSSGVGQEARKLQFNKRDDILDHQAVGKLAALTVPKQGPGYYVPPLGGGEDALVNMLPVQLPEQIFLASTSYDGKKATAILLDAFDAPRFDWTINGRTFWSFHDPREEATHRIVDLDQVEAVDTTTIAFHEDIHEQNNFAFLLRKTLQHQFDDELRWDKSKKLFYFLAKEKNTNRDFRYDSAKKKATTTVVNVVRQKASPDRIAFVRHHAFIPRFECFGDEWNLIVTPTYHFTVNGFIPHSYPDGLLAGKKRFDNNASLRGQLIMWHRLLSRAASSVQNLFEEDKLAEAILAFKSPPILSLPTAVPEDAWGSPKRASEQDDTKQAELWTNAV